MHQCGYLPIFQPLTTCAETRFSIRVLCKGKSAFYSNVAWVEDHDAAFQKRLGLVTTRINLQSFLTVKCVVA